MPEMTYHGKLRNHPTALLRRANRRWQGAVLTIASILGVYGMLYLVVR